jgi:hypothetical protein
MTHRTRIAIVAPVVLFMLALLPAAPLRAADKPIMVAPHYRGQCVEIL